MQQNKASETTVSDREQDNSMPGKGCPIAILKQ